ncbi:MAG: hypothetical protein EXR52_01630 [Dehalococcoidia bacterium]|nr:hypothetical protein [Dehalococcoidia bacterium]
MGKREQAVEAYMIALRCGENAAVERARPHLAADVVQGGGKTDVVGQKDVLFRVSGQWPNTPVLAQGAWSGISKDGDKLKVGATFASLGAAPAAIDITFSFNAQDQISRIDQVTTPQPPPTPSNALPDNVKAMVNDALRNGTPMICAYTDEEGRPSLSMRGSVVAWSDTELAIWVRSPEGGIVKAMGSNNNVSLLYRDQKNRSTLIFQGKGRIATDQETRDRLFEMTPEVEQNHVPDRTGAALIIALDRAMGGTPRGGFRFSKA